MLKPLFILIFLFLYNSGYSQYVLKWTEQKLQITLPNTPLELDTLDEGDYLECIDDDYDFAFEMIQKGHKDFTYIKDLYAYAEKEMREMSDLDEYGEDGLKVGKLEGLNSFYAVMSEEEVDKKTGIKYKLVIGELVFFHPKKKKLYYFDIEFDGESMDKVENLLKSIQFYE